MDRRGLYNAPIRVEDQRPTTWQILSRLFAPLGPEITPEMDRQFDLNDWDEEVRRMQKSWAEDDKPLPPIRDFKGHTYPTLDEYINRNRK